MGELDLGFVVAVYGHPPSFHPAAGPLMALVSVEAGADRVLIDRERGRIRIEATPGPRDLDKWSSPAGLILAARRGAWGLSIVEDRYAGREELPPPGRSGRPRGGGRRPPREPVPSFGRYLRASIPEDLCSCLRCRDLVIVRRSRWDGSPAAMAAPGRLFRRALAILGGIPGCQGPGASAVDHGRDCTAFRLLEPGAIRRDRRARGILLAQLLRRLIRDPVGSAWLRPGKGVPHWSRELRGGGP